MYGTYVQYLDITIDSIRSMLRRLTTQAAAIEKLLKDINVAENEIKAGDQEILNKELKISGVKDKKCYFQKCMNYDQMWKLRGKDYLVLGQGAAKAGALANNIASRLRGKTLDKATLSKIKKFNSYAVPLGRAAKTWERRVDQINLHRRSVPAISMAKQEKSLFSKMFSKFKNYFAGSNNKDKKQNDDNTKYHSTERSINPYLKDSDFQYEASIDHNRNNEHSNKDLDVSELPSYIYPTIYDKNKSIWKIISSRYNKIFITSPN
jgi:hypothetical protein